MRRIEPLVAKASAAFDSDADQSAQLGAVSAGFVACALITLVMAAVYHGEIAELEAQRAEAIAIEAETRALCSDLGVAPGSGLYQHCEEGLAAVRQRQQQRLATQSTGVL
jgi:hypothetical protein